MEIVVLGSGSAFPDAADVRNPAGYAARLAGRVLALDLGFGNVRQLARAGLDPAEITDVFVSHLHPDHIGDIPALLFWFHSKLKPRAGLLRLWGPRGLSKLIAAWRAAQAPWLEPRGYALEIRELAGGAAVRQDDWRVETLDVPHPIEALAYKLHYKGKTVVYSGDTGFCPELADFAAEADLFLLECAMAEAEALDGHLFPRLALETLRASGCRRGLLTHVSQAAAAELGRLLARGGRFSVARDLQRVRI